MIWSIHYIVEPLMALMMLGMISASLFQSSIFQADQIYALTKNDTFTRNCLYNKTDEICVKVSKEAINTVSNWHTYISLEMGLLGMVFNLVFGYFSDRTSRKLILIISTLSMAVPAAVLLYNSLHLSMPIYWHFLANPFTYIFGGFGAFIATTFAYISDCSDQSNRTTRIAFADAALQLGAVAAAAIGGEMISYSAYYSVPLMAIVIYVAIAVYTAVVIRNPSKEKRPRESSLYEAIRGMVDIYIIRTENSVRIYVLSLAYLLHFTAFLAHISFFTNYLLNPPFNWQTSRIGFITSLSSIANLLFVLILPLAKRFNLNEAVIGAVACFACAAGFGSMSVFKTFELMCVSMTLKAGSGVALTLYRSRLSRLIKPSQYGQLFAFLNSCESLATLFSSVALYQIYIATKDWYNGFCFHILLLIEVAAFILTIVDGVLEKRDQNRGPGISVCSDDKAILVTDDRTQARNINYAED